MTVKAGICVAYDWGLLRQSLPALYPIVERICLSIDSNHQSWNGNAFELDLDGLKQMVKEIDSEGKIVLLEEAFFSSNRTPIANECYQRRRMAETLGASDWIVQLDTDEILINPEHFLQQLKFYNNSKRPLNIHGIWINLIKKTSGGFIYSVLKTPPLATNSPEYQYGRTNGHFNVYTNTFLAHITLARPELEVKYKLENWGHSHEFNGGSFFKIWQALDDFNWRYLKDFHPMSKTAIPELYYQDASSIEDLTTKISLEGHKLSWRELSTNNIWMSRFNKILRRFK